MAAVNCDAHKAACSAQGVRGYPTIKAFVPGSGPVDYPGDRSAKSISDWALSLIPSKVVSVGKQEHLTGLLAQCGGSGGSRGSKGGKASWALCVVLITAKSETPSLYKSLSGVYAGKVAFGELRASGAGVTADQAAVAKRLGVDLAAEKAAGKLPLLVTVCNGDVALVERYAGQLKSEPLARHLDTYAAGKKCGKMVRLDAKTDLGKFSAGQLKQIIKDKGLDCLGCMEKEDYVKRLQDYIASGAS